MRLKVINSNSSGNAYLLYNNREALLIECGVPFARIKKALDYNLRCVVAAVVSHCHKDHSKSMLDVVAAGIPVYSSAGTHEAMLTKGHHNARVTFSGDQFTAGGFTIKAFDTKHDCPEPLCYLIHHEETGTILFLTDSYYVEYKFSGLNNIMIEANYCKKILDARLAAGENPKFLRDRVLTSHMSIDHCIETLKANDLSKVNNVVLIHLSDSNSNEAEFKKKVEAATAKRVTIALPGVDIPFDSSPF